MAEDLLAKYLREVDQAPVLTQADEEELARRIEEGDAEARDLLVRCNLRLVVSIARTYVGKALALPDLIEEGNLGLLKAVEAFAPGASIRFSVLASDWIKKVIEEALARPATD